MGIKTAAVLMLVALPLAAHAQGFVGGARNGYDSGDRVAGPLGGLVGGAIGAGVGTVRGAIGVDAPPAAPVVYAPAEDTYAPHRRHFRHHHRRFHRHN